MRVVLVAVLVAHGVATAGGGRPRDWNAYNRAVREAEAALDAGRAEEALERAWKLFKEDDPTDDSSAASLVLRASLRTGTCSTIRARLGPSARDRHLEALFLAEESSFRAAADIMAGVLKQIAKVHGTQCVLGEPRTVHGLLELASGDEQRGRATLARVERCKRVVPESLDTAFMHVDSAINSPVTPDRRLKQWNDAIGMLEQRLGSRSPWVAFALARRAELLETMGRGDQARADRDRAAAIRREPFQCGEDGTRPGDAGRP